MSEVKKVVLAYSGGLDTSIIIPWLKENSHGMIIDVSRPPEYASTTFLTSDIGTASV